MTVLSVSKLNFYLRSLLDGDAPLQNLYIGGEISNFKRYPTSGHCYFTLRDEKAQLKCVLFAAQGAHLRFAPENGMQVICRGRVSVYERDGVYQLYVDDMQPQGVGALAVAFEQLKTRLAAAGLFDESHKKPIPKYPRRIGVATSAYGAAVADIKQITARRFPAAELVIAPTVVQGDGAPESIARSIERLDQMGLDVLIVGRGGGSMEDLWAFNTETVINAVYTCKTPIISAVGHETDFTITDFVADLRAPTPSAAAELAVPDREEELRRIAELESGNALALRRQLEREQQRLDSCLARQGSAGAYLAARQERLQALLVACRRQAVHKMETEETRLQRALERIEAYSPLAVLRRGYTLVRRTDGTPVTKKDAITPGTVLQLQFADGSVPARVLEEREDG